MESSTAPVEISAEKPSRKGLEAPPVGAFHGLNKRLCNRDQVLCLPGLVFSPPARMKRLTGGDLLFSTEGRVTAV
jgi:hypothetical protein